MKRFFLLVLSLCLASFTYGANLDEWTDDQLCGWMQSSNIPKNISDEVNDRELYCKDGISTQEEINVVEVVVEVTVVEIIEVEKVVEAVPITSADEDLSFGIAEAKKGDFNSAIDYQPCL